jgi:hypothetical protein
MRTCTCKEWEPGIDKINAYISLQFARSGGATQYTGKPFEYCPWCGTKLIDEKQKLKKNLHLSKKLDNGVVVCAESGFM